MRRLPLVLATFIVLSGHLVAADTPPEGVTPVGPDGRKLNLDFETGTLQDWTAEGDAFAGQPIDGDTVTPRRPGMKSQHEGRYWIGTYERGKGDRPQGTLSSVPFKVTHPWASFLIGGGFHETTCVEIVLKNNDIPLARVSGVQVAANEGQENMYRVAVDLTSQVGREVYIRVVDRHSGHWGHINFDDFRFHSSKPNLPPRPGSVATMKADAYKYAGLSPEKAAAAMTVPEGFTVTLFAGEPDVHQPIAFCLDDRGRLWVAEAYCYPLRRPEGQGTDRILIFEDTDGDGKFDKKTVFMEKLNLVSGIEYGFGGIWIGAAPYLMFVPIDASGDKPAGPPKILLDGWAYQDTHETLNTFTWGPDGWLYGCHGVFTYSRVGKPGTSDKDRVPINAGIWRYHPVRHEFEVFAHGTSNPWGIDFNDRGQLFCEACVIPHCYHVIQGGRYQRQAGSHFNPYTYADIQTIADHRHYLGANPHGGNNRSDGAGGGHAHCGLMAYLGGAWPAEYRDKLFMGNIHGRRINMDVPKPQGSGYVASHGQDFLLANDEWARFINMRYGPDGNVYLIDWYDKQACHDRKDEIWDRTNGRIYKISYRGTKPVTGVDLQNSSTRQLLDYQLSSNDWYVRHARRILQERQAAFRGLTSLDELRGILGQAWEHPDETRRLRGLWAAHAVIGMWPDDLVLAQLSNSSPHVRAWALQMALEPRYASPRLAGRLAELAKSDPSPVVRLYLASALQRLSLDQRWDILAELLKHPEDATDHNLPLMYWYAFEPLAEVDASRALHMAAHAKQPLLGYMARRIAAIGTPEAIAELIDRLNRSDDSVVHAAILTGLRDGLKGRRNVPMPAEWPTAFAKLMRGDLRNQAIAVAVMFGDAKAFETLRGVLTAATEPPAARRDALAALVAAKDAQLGPLLLKLLGNPVLRGDALRALAAYDDPKTSAAVIGVYASLSSTEKRDALNTLAARPEYGKALIEAVAAKTIPAAEVSADVVRQLRNLRDPALDKRLGEVWGVVRKTPADRARAIADLKHQLVVAGPAADRSLGRAVFAKTCQQCHTLFGVGSKVGPEITGANRASLDYILENILDPSAVIPKDYMATRVVLTNGRIVTGLVRGETPNSIQVITANETLTVPRSDIDSMEPSEQSMMPDDLLKPLGQQEVRALVAYLQGTEQAPMLATKENAKDLFNGTDLTGWDGDAKLWRVENGEIVGKSPGIKHNEFLKSHLTAEDFKLTLKVKLVPNKENSGVQFRSAALPNGEMKGHQADIGAGWWGKLYEENGRGLLVKEDREKFVKVDDWNEYVIEAVGTRIKTWLNGQLCVDYDDPAGAKRGIFALQIHSGGPMEVRFKDIKFEVK
jgi:putative membrane-bound dehydrogenase-like protein